MELLVNRKGMNWHERYMQAVINGETYAIIAMNTARSYYAVKKDDPVTNDMMPLYEVKATQKRNGEYNMKAERIKCGTAEAWVHLKTKDYTPNDREGVLYTDRLLNDAEALWDAEKFFLYSKKKEIWFQYGSYGISGAYEVSSGIPVDAETVKSQILKSLKKKKTVMVAFPNGNRMEVLSC